MLIAAWVAATATAFALIASLGVFWVQRQDAQRQQARQVSAWVTSTTPILRPNPSRPSGSVVVPSDNPDHNFRVHLMVRNASVEPVWDLTVGVLSDWGGSPERAADTEMGVLPPKTEDFDLMCKPIFPGPKNDVMPDQFPPVRISFADASGRRWVRTPSGQLLYAGKARRRVGAWNEFVMRWRSKLKRR